MRFGSTVFSLKANIFEIILQSTFNNDIGLQLLIRRLYLSFFSNNLITTCLWDVTNFLLSFGWFNEFVKDCFSSYQKVSQNSFVRPSFPGYLLLLKLFIARITSCSLIPSSQTFFFLRTAVKYL